MYPLSNLRRFAFPIAGTAGGATAAQFAQDLADAHVPFLTALACCLAVFATSYTAVRWVIELLCGTTHRCRAAGCSFRVRVTGTDPGESRRWQEIAAAHPTHDRMHH